MCMYSVFVILMSIFVIQVPIVSYLKQERFTIVYLEKRKTLNKVSIIIVVVIIIIIIIITSARRLCNHYLRQEVM